MKKLILTGISGLVSFFLVSQMALAQNNLTPETRKDMAKHHEEVAKFHQELASCLTSDKPLSECQSLMTTGCTTMQGKTQMWMRGMMGKGHMRGQGMGQGKGGMMGGIYGCPLPDDDK